MGACSLRVVSVNVSLPKNIGERNGEEILSAIGKRPIRSETIEAGKINLAGDAQSDREHHGGPDKAIYAYPTENWPWWEKEHHFPCGAGAFGENLTLAGADETAIRIGDRFSWGDVELEVSQPRVPCYKFLLYSARDDAGALMTMAGRCGWYFRVRRTGSALTKGADLLRRRENDGPTVREAFFAAFDRRVDARRRLAIANLPTLSEAWRRRLLAIA
jgi:MOSC domain-containing protein YiiM